MELALLLFFFSILLFLGVRFLCNQAGFKSNKFVAAFFLCLFLLLFLLFCSTIYLSEKGWYYWGFRSSSWVFLAMTLAGVIYFLLIPDSKLLFTWLVLPFMITIVSVGLSSLLIYAVMADYKADLVYKGNKHRLERTGWFITPCHLPELFVKKGLLEQKYKYSTNYCLGRRDIDSVKIIEGSNDSIRVVFYHHSDWKDMPNPIEVTAISK